MKVAVVALTKQGIQKGAEVEKALTKRGHQVMFFVPGKYSLLKLPGHRSPFRKPLRDLMAELMHEYEAIVCIMALGIVVRLIAPHLQDKRTDPAVVVLDEKGCNVISVLSGHWGGANGLTSELAQEMGANPVITTATDVQGLPAIEMMAKEKGWAVGDFSLVKKVNAAIVNCALVHLYCDEEINTSLPKNVVQFPVYQFKPTEDAGALRVVVTNRFLPGNSEDTLFLRPKNLVLGIGCRKGVSKAALRDAVIDALAKANVVFESVRAIASVDLKAKEPALLELAGEWNIPVQFYSPGELQKVFSGKESGKLTRSKFVKEKLGVDGVCEPAALLETGNQGKLILPKTSGKGVTVAIAEDI